MVGELLQQIKGNNGHGVRSSTSGRKMTQSARYWLSWYSKKSELLCVDGQSHIKAALNSVLVPDTRALGLCILSLIVSTWATHIAGRTVVHC